MSEVERYAFTVSDEYVGAKPRTDGAFVLYGEYAALQQKLEATEALMLAMRDDSRESRSKLELVVAENAALKKCAEFYADGFMPISIMNGPSHLANNALLNDAGSIARTAIETPATDAMVNEIRAEGVELYADATIAIGKSENDEAIIYAGNQALLFANKLRANTAKDGE